jgi:RimJ/RimL family protein N-acetyltransferase
MMVRLVPMGDAQFKSYIEQLIEGYAQEHVQAGNWSAAEGQKKAAEQVRSLLPEGVATPEHYLFSIETTGGEESEGEAVGVLWFALRDRGGKRSAFIYDIMIFEEARRKGYAAQALEQLEAMARELGLSEIALHVFGHNVAARALYDKMRYEEVDIIMAKQL